MVLGFSVFPLSVFHLYNPRLQHSRWGGRHAACGWTGANERPRAFFRAPISPEGTSERTSERIDAEALRSRLCENGKRVFLPLIYINSLTYHGEASLHEEHEVRGEKHEGRIDSGAVVDAAELAAQHRCDAKAQSRRRVSIANRKSRERQSRGVYELFTIGSSKKTIPR